MAGNRTTLVIAKAPAPGRSKTRLVPPLTPEQAADLQAALILDTLAACRRECATVGILHAADDEIPALRALVGDDAPLVRQRGAGLGDALGLTMADHTPAGPVAIVSGDIAGTPPGAVAEAFERLEGGADVVLGPALDGGYWLIAMRGFHEAPFRAIPWSTPAVMPVTEQRCADAGLRVERVATWRDLDTLVDLDFAAREIMPAIAPRTSAQLQALVAAGLVTSPPELSLIASELLASSPWRSVIRDQLAVSCGGAPRTYDYLAVPRAAFVVAVTGDGQMLLVRQYRHPVRDWTLEVPAGAAEDGESGLAAAKRELREEVGGTARDWRHLTTFFSSSAHLSLRSDAYLATGVTLGVASPDEMERLDVVRMPVAEAIALARAGRVTEGQSALAILLAAPYLEGDA